MNTYSTGQSAPYGVYASAKPLDLCFVSAEGDTLEGKDGSRYVRIPTLLVIALSPAIGGAFVMLFPVLILAALAGTLAQVVARGVRSAFNRNAHVAQMRWEPAAAYLHKNGEDADESADDAEADDQLENLAEEVEVRRDAEK